MERDFLNSIAQKHFDIPYLYPYQRLVINNILEAAGVDGFSQRIEINPVTGEEEIYDTRPNQIVILPTGSGKSLCFMLPAILLSGPTLIIFPLLSLISDQTRRLIEQGFNPVVIRGGQTRQERETFWEDIRAGKTKFILSNPETILQEKVLASIKKLNITHLVIDEMHIVTEWGDTFRPAYLNIYRIYKETEIGIVTAFTATASENILSRVKQILFPGISPAVITANPDRPNIHYRVLRSISKSHDLCALISGNLMLDRKVKDLKIEKPLLIFNRSRTGAELTARHLREKLNSENILFYHAGLSKEEKTKVEKWFFHSTDGILSSTCAYGMGLDKQDIRTVIHMDPCPSVEAYLQESGRAGRDKKDASAVLIVSESDFFFENETGNQILKKRYLQFLHAVTDNDNCRRKTLLRLLGSSSDFCSGCDVCSRDILQSICGYEHIISLIRKYNRKLSLREALITLTGEQYLEVYKSGNCFSPFYGIMKDWTEREVKDGILELISEGIISIPRHGFYRGKLIMKYH